jgi:hypothetical protein
MSGSSRKVVEKAVDKFVSFFKLTIPMQVTHWAVNISYVNRFSHLPLFMSLIFNALIVHKKVNS